MNLKSNVYAIAAIGGAAVTGFVAGYWWNSLDDYVPFSRGMGSATAAIACSAVRDGNSTPDRVIKTTKEWLDALDQRYLDRTQFNYGFNEVAVQVKCSFRL